PAEVSSMPLLPLRMRFSSTSLRGSRATSAAFASRWAPLASSVTTTAARRAARSVFRLARISSFIFRPLQYPNALLHLLHIHPNRAAAREPDLPGALVGDAEFESLGLAAFDHVERFGNHSAFNASARDRAQKISLVVDHQIGADRPRRRTPGFHHRCKSHATALAAP